MTERLAALLHDEAAGLPVPPPPVTAVVRRGRRLRTRRRLGSGVAVAAALAVVAGSGLVLQHAFAPDDRGTRPDAVDPLAAYHAGGAYAVGSTVWFGDGRYRADVQGKVKALYYTSVGVVVRTGAVPWTDDAGPNHYALATPDGDLQPLDLTLRDVKPGTSPGSPYLAYASRAGDDAWTLHFYDVRTGRDASTVPVSGAFTWGGWVAPPVALDGDTAYVALDDGMVSVDRATGTVATVPTLPASYFPTVAGGHGERPSRGGDGNQIVDVATGRALLTGPATSTQPRSAAVDWATYFWLSPDGRYALGAEGGLDPDGRAAAVYDVDTGRHADLPGDAHGLGWTPDGHLLRVTRSEVSVCEPVTGSCETHAVDLGKGLIRIGGNDNES